MLLLKKIVQILSPLAISLCGINRLRLGFGYVPGQLMESILAESLFRNPYHPHTCFPPSTLVRLKCNDHSCPNPGLWATDKSPARARGLLFSRKHPKVTEICGREPTDSREEHGERMSYQVTCQLAEAPQVDDKNLMYLAPSEQRLQVREKMPYIF